MTCECRHRTKQQPRLHLFLPLPAMSPPAKFLSVFLRGVSHVFTQNRNAPTVNTNRAWQLLPGDTGVTIKYTSRASSEPLHYLLPDTTNFSGLHHWSLESLRCKSSVTRPSFLKKKKKCTIQVIFSILTRLCNHYQDLIPINFYHPRKKFHTH